MEKEIPEEMYQSATSFGRVLPNDSRDPGQPLADQCQPGVIRYEPDAKGRLDCVDGKRISHKGKNWKEK